MEYIEQIKIANKRTPILAILRKEGLTDIPNQVMSDDNHVVVYGEADDLKPWLNRNSNNIVTQYCDRRNSKMELLDITELNARIEPGATIRQGVTIGKEAVILMGAIINVGATIGDNTMIDMNAVIGSGAFIGSKCHIGAGAVISGMMEPISHTPVTIEDDVLIGANATILEGVCVHHHAVVAAGSVVIHDVKPYEIVGGVPARLLKMRSDTNPEKINIVEDLRLL